MGQHGVGSISKVVHCHDHLNKTIYLFSTVFCRLYWQILNIWDEGWILRPLGCESRLEAGCDIAMKNRLWTEVVWESLLGRDRSQIIAIIFCESRSSFTACFMSLESPPHCWGFSWGKRMKLDSQTGEYNIIRSRLTSSTAFVICWGTSVTWFRFSCELLLCWGLGWNRDRGLGFAFQCGRRSRSRWCWNPVLSPRDVGS